MTKYYRQILSGTVVELDPDVDTIPVDAVELTETEVSRHLAPKKTASTFEEQSWEFKRRMSYPPITDYLDGVVKGDQAQIDAYIAACQAVKDRYPKT
jgi:hypothetical protein